MDEKQTKKVKNSKIASPNAKNEKKVVKKTKGTMAKSKKVTTAKKSNAKNVAVKKGTLKDPKNIKILGYNDLELNTYVFDNVQNPKAVVVIIHGMQEHCLRYTDFARFLNENGYIVVTSDSRGHGHTALSKELLGYGEKDIYAETVKDQLSIITYVNENFNLPIYLFGHSYGSMISQKLIQCTPLIEKCVLSGTTNGDSGVMKAGNMVVGILSPFKKKTSKGGLVEKMCITSYGKGFERGNWLTRDEKAYDKYLQDEYCGGSFPFSFYKSLIQNMNKVNKGIDKIGSKKVFLIAGDQDPVGAKGKQVTKLYKLYLKHNINARIKLYHDARHELVNELCKNEVYQDILNFYNEQ